MSSSPFQENKRVRPNPSNLLWTAPFCWVQKTVQTRESKASWAMELSFFSGKITTNSKLNRSRIPSNYKKYWPKFSKPQPLEKLTRTWEIILRTFKRIMCSTMISLSWQIMTSTAKPSKRLIAFSRIRMSSAREVWRHSPSVVIWAVTSPSLPTANRFGTSSQWRFLIHLWTPCRE